MSSNVLADSRASLEAWLDAQGIVWADHGQPITPPGVVIRAGEPWLIPGDTYGAWSVALDVDAIAGPRLTREGLLELEQLVTTVADAIPIASTWSAPAAAQVGDQTYLYSTTTVVLDNDDRIPF